jgi:spoIIIJ-associated protein
METKHSVEITAETVDEAVAVALRQLNAQPHEVLVEVLEEPSRGLLGIGAKPARVMVKRLALPTARAEPELPPPASIEDEDDTESAQPDDDYYPAFDIQGADESALDDEGRIARDILLELLSRMGLKSQIVVRRSEIEQDDDAAPWLLNVSGHEDVSRLIGSRGATLNALQYITRLIVSRHIQRRSNVIVDVDGYKSRRSDKLRVLANRMADQAVQQARSMTLEPMPPNERRIIHLELRRRDDVDTHSVGEGSSRKVVIVPR